MITEDYVSFETAKLLKEKWFDEATYRAYIETNKEHQLSFDVGRNNSQWEKINKENGIFNCSAPTLQMAMKWLREVQGLNIYARGVWKDVEVSVFGDWEPAVVGYEWFIESLTDDTYSKTSTEQFLTYEEACEAAIKYCLENLI